MIHQLSREQRVVIHKMEASARRVAHALAGLMAGELTVDVEQDTSSSPPGQGGTTGGGMFVPAAGKDTLPRAVGSRGVLKHLSLRGNCIGTSQVEALARGLARSSTMKSLSYVHPNSSRGCSCHYHGVVVSRFGEGT